MPDHLGRLLILLPLFGLGCSDAHGPMARWISRSGGLLTDGADRRPQALLRQFGEKNHLGRPARAFVLRSDEFAAYSWPDGSIFVTAALVDCLGDAELSAVLAHELGHLLRSDPVAAPVGLNGSGRAARPGNDKEAEADAVGVELLKRQGLSPGSMISMLEKVAAAEPTGSACRPAILRRIERLRRSNAFVGLQTSD